MPKTDQSAAARPIAFVLHDTVHDKPQEVFTFNIRPEDLVRSEPSNVSVVQTLGGAWADVNGPGLATCTISGTTGWGAGGLPDGFEQFKKLHNTVFEQYHKLRAQASAEGKDPDGIKLIFSDGLDEFVWVIAPQNFNLRRNRARPLLSQYQISMTKLDDNVAVIVPVIERSTMAALSSLDRSISAINKFASSIKGTVASVLGPIQNGVKSVMGLTGDALTGVRKLVAAGKNVAHSALAPVMEIAHGLTQVSLNVMGIVASAKSLPLSVKSEILEVKSALNNAACLLRNAVKDVSLLPDYSSLYGASNCSSTSGGLPASIWADRNVFPLLFPASASPVIMSAQAESAMKALSSIDVQNPPPITTTAGLLDSIGTGTTISSEAVDKAIAGASASAGKTPIMGADVAYV